MSAPAHWLALKNSVWLNSSAKCDPVGTRLQWDNMWRLWILSRYSEYNVFTFSFMQHFCIMMYEMSSVRLGCCDLHKDQEAFHDWWNVGTIYYTLLPSSQTLCWCFPRLCEGLILQPDHLHQWHIHTQTVFRSTSSLSQKQIICFHFFGYIFEEMATMTPSDRRERTPVRWFSKSS